MIRFKKRIAIFCYVLCIIGIVFEVAGIVRLGIDIGAISCFMCLVILGVPGYFQYKSYKKYIKKYNKLLKSNRLKKIEFMICEVNNYRGLNYTIVFYINGEKSIIRIPAYKCKNNNNYEYYLEPIYKKNGEFKDFIVYADKKNDHVKCMHSTNEIREYEEKLSEAHRQKANK
ncbi:hypothetical protein [Clostridium felsineum]|uniref:hypothetical protein n=1 Tax=Clostridium felsineum TaxID=36839 RepID=UPI00098CBC99|nr:hypothetical protein [Clostridium felsineum]URZ03932.1 hypothetical protein CLAUR_039980 [Clostridium felsineum]